jgi:hypothetical protein
LIAASKVEVTEVDPPFQMPLLEAHLKVLNTPIVDVLKDVPQEFAMALANIIALVDWTVSPPRSWRTLHQPGFIGQRAGLVALVQAIHPAWAGLSRLVPEDDPYKIVKSDFEKLFGAFAEAIGRCTIHLIQSFFRLENTRKPIPYWRWTSKFICNGQVLVAKRRRVEATRVPVFREEKGRKVRGEPEVKHLPQWPSVDHAGFASESEGTLISAVNHGLKTELGRARPQRFRIEAQAHSFNNGVSALMSALYEKTDSISGMLKSRKRDFFRRKPQAGTATKFFNENIEAIRKEYESKTDVKTALAAEIEVSFEAYEITPKPRSPLTTPKTLDLAQPETAAFVCEPDKVPKMEGPKAFEPTALIEPASTSSKDETWEQEDERSSSAKPLTAVAAAAPWEPQHKGESLLDMDLGGEVLAVVPVKVFFRCRLSEVAKFFDFLLKF